MTELEYPDYGSASQLIGSTPLTPQSKSLLNGIYTLDEIKNELGELCVIKSNKEKVSMFFGKSKNFFIMESGIIDNKIILEGYWRDLINQVTGISRFTIDYNEGAKEIIEGTQPDSMIIRGIIEAGRNKKVFVMKFRDKLKSDSSFYIIAHRGGGRNSDKLPASENSLEIIELAESLGANAIEIDVRITKDNVPVLFHDDFISSRLVNGDFLTGPIENYNFSHLRKLCKLKNGETLPSLDEALDLVINKTGLRLVWLDIKSSNSLQYIVPIIEANKSKANAINRNVDIAVGIPDEAIENEFISNSYFNNVSSLCEVS
ncbi:MAG: glycerophosphodiester phosphodiesterase family protein, partial [Bacteroidetes bacterium]|nr:glycerophosphodiester phosphodiesterase family protein [Bacteroidota bacterium]